RATIEGGPSCPGGPAGWSPNASPSWRRPLPSWTSWWKANRDQGWLRRPPDVPFGVPLPELPAVLRGPDRVGHRHGDAVGGRRLAGAEADGEQRGPRDPAGPELRAHPVTRCMGRPPGGPPGQAGHPDRNPDRVRPPGAGAVGAGVRRDGRAVDGLRALAVRRDRDGHRQP